jgi:hypothetical protein
MSRHAKGRRASQAGHACVNKSLMKLILYQQTFWRLPHRDKGMPNIRAVKYCLAETKLSKTIQLKNCLMFRHRLPRYYSRNIKNNGFSLCSPVSARADNSTQANWTTLVLLYTRPDHSLITTHKYNLKQIIKAIHSVREESASGGFLTKPIFEKV